MSSALRLPWRELTKSTKPLAAAATLLRPQPTTPSRPAFSSRYASSVAEPPSDTASTEDAKPTSSTPQAETASPSPETELAAATLPTKDIRNDESEPERKGLDFRLPRSVQAVYLRPLKRQAEYGVPSCDLQMRSYSVRNLEFFADFALRAAYYLKLPASGPVPLPRIVERWTVPKSSFIYKKSQENFERRTVRRLIQIKDGHPETVGIWLAFLRKHAYYGIGMKANVFEFTKLGVGKNMDIDMEQMKDALDKTWSQIGIRKDKQGGPTAERIMELVNREDFRAATHGNAPFTKPPV